MEALHVLLPGRKPPVRRVSYCPLPVLHSGQGLAFPPPPYSAWWTSATLMNTNLVGTCPVAGITDVLLVQ